MPSDSKTPTAPVDSPASPVPSEKSPEANGDKMRVIGIPRRRVDARHAAFSILGMTTFYFVAARRYPQFFTGDAIAPKALAERKKAMLDLLMHGLLQPQKRQSRARRLQGKKQ